MKLKTYISAMVLAVILLLAMPFVPHHHHGSEICVATEMCDDDLPQSSHDECMGKSFFVAERTVDRQIVMEYNLLNAGLQVATMDELAVYVVERMAIPALDKEPTVPDDYGVCVSGLRAPPMA